MSTAQIETPRILLRQWRLEDRDPFSRINADCEVMRYFPYCLSRDQSDAYADHFESLIRKRGWGFWAAESRADRCFIGFVGLNIPAPDLPFKPCVEIGWRLARNAWHQGYATEAARACLHFGFEKLQLPEIVSFTTLGNQRSKAVMKRLGMIEDPLRFQHPSVPEGSPLREHCLYRISSASWRSSQG